MKLRQSLFELAFFQRQSGQQNPDNFLVKMPHLINGHRVKIQFVAHQPLPITAIERASRVTSKRFKIDVETSS
jgi:hypothetical protein